MSMVRKGSIFYLTKLRTGATAARGQTNLTLPHCIYSKLNWHLWSQRHSTREPLLILKKPLK